MSVFVLVSLFGWLGVRPVAADEVAPRSLIGQVSFTSETSTRGFTVTDADSGIRVIVAPQTFSGPATLLLERSSGDDVPAYRGSSRVSQVLHLTVTTSDGQPLRQPITVDFPFSTPQFNPTIGKWHPDTATWEELGSSIRPGGAFVRTADDQPSFSLALFTQPGLQIGQATYYGTYRRTTNLTLVAASNTFPRGQVLRVTNLDNQKTVTVRVVDTGGFRYPTVIDLSTPAFAKIQPTWKGVANVRVEKATPSNAPPSDTTATPPSADPTATPPTSDGQTPPTTAATASIVVDVRSGSMLVGKRLTTPMPIASLTKLMTAAVFLDTKPDLAQVVTYQSADNTICSCLHLAEGEAVTLKDLLFATLVGSANNAALALVRATGVSRAEFVDRMNAKAAALGLTNTSYVDPTGLESGNVSTVTDLAVLGRVLPDTYPAMRRILRTGAYEFRSKNDVCLGSYHQSDGSCRHAFKTTNKLLGQTPFTIVAAKTGFIDEARHTFLLRSRDAAGHEVVLVFLRVQSKTDSFAHAKALTEWIFNHYRWT